ncbi:MAG TPA: Na/Pi cotransporter family protein [Bosea sp. (in: a-proteobacteria)]|jgi:phosphate:Na+ symporter|uniref:Na/Pi cotransporter family protein n=1 Tax=Bosea sp. (in: a-proteobacteria) TaxID=1871050 RepID=UPI002E1625E9|nr:Na/Pi cotransporter family protein [Bosea sp. (in: a-proteobacteria)]
MNASDNATTILIHLAGGVALLIWAVRLVRTGAMRAFGVSLRQALQSFTRNRFAAFGSGIAVTMVLQSSTATTLLVSSFAGRDLIVPAMALAVLLGANLGTALAAFVISMDLGWVWGLCLAVGVALYLGHEAMDRARNIGRVLVGIGLILLSLIELNAAAAPLAQSPTFRTVLSALSGEPLLAVLVAVAATWLTHSSIAVILLIATFAASGLFPPATAIALVLGANLGNALIPVLDQIGAPAAQRRAAVGNLVTRLVLVAALLPFAKPLSAWLNALPGPDARLAIEFHVGLNLIGALIFLPFVGPISALVGKLMPGQKSADAVVKPRHLDPSVLDSPTEALAGAMREALSLGDRVEAMLHDTMQMIEKDELKLSRAIAEADDGVDAIHESIKLYLVKVSRNELSEAESRRLLEIITLITNLEHIGDIIDKNLRELGEKKIRKRYAFSPEGLAEIRDFHQRVASGLRLALNVFATRDVALARQLFAEKAPMRDAERHAAESHFERLRSGRPESIETSAIHLDIIRDLKRIHGHAASIGYPILESANALRESRLKADEEAKPEVKLAPATQPGR